MFFKSKIIFLFPLFFLLSCGLAVNEDPYDISTLKIDQYQDQDSFCFTIDYENSLKRFLLSSSSGIKTQERTDEVFSCIIPKAYKFKDAVRGKRKDRLSSDEIITILNIPAIKTPELEGVINKISKSENFSKILKFKDSLIATINLFEQDKMSESSGVCPAKYSNSLQDTDVDTFLNFISKFPEEFKKIQFAADSLYFNTRGLEWSEAEANNRKSKFMFKLESFLKQHFPDWYDYIKSNEGLDLAEEHTGVFWYYPGHQMHKGSRIPNTLGNTLYKTTLLNDSFQTKNSSFKEDIQLMVLNIYFVDLLMKIYDANKDHKLSGIEIDRASCLFIPFLSIFVADEADGLGMKDWFLSSANIFHYILYHKTINRDVVSYLQGFVPVVFSRLAGQSINRFDLAEIIHYIFEVLFPFEYIYSDAETNQSTISK